MKLKKVPKTDEDYVIFYAENLKINPELFKQHKEIIDSQVKSSISLFGNMFGNKNFKIEARKYLKGRKLV